MKKRIKILFDMRYNEFIDRIQDINDDLETESYTLSYIYGSYILGHTNFEECGTITTTIYRFDFTQLDEFLQILEMRLN